MTTRNTPTPASLDRNKKDSQQEDNFETVDLNTIDTEKDSEKETEKEDDRPQIVFDERIIKADGTQDVKRHGPMPVDEWDDYARKHGF